MLRYSARLSITLLFLHIFLNKSFSQKDSLSLYHKSSLVIPMRDGISLYSIVLAPLQKRNLALPILLKRTPYGVDNQFPDSIIDLFNYPIFSAMAQEGYIFVFQDVRGKYKSEGYMEINQPITSQAGISSVDESTDTYDTIDWLIKNIEGNNGKVGLYGISYGGWLAL